MMTDLYAQPQQVEDVTLAFPAVLGGLLPPLEAIPANYRTARSGWDSNTSGSPAHCHRTRKSSLPLALTPTLPGDT